MITNNTSEPVAGEYIRQTDHDPDQVQINKHEGEIKVDNEGHFSLPNPGRNRPSTPPMLRGPSVKFAVASKSDSESDGWTYDTLQESGVHSSPEESDAEEGFVVVSHKKAPKKAPVRNGKTLAKAATEGRLPFRVTRDLLNSGKLTAVETKASKLRKEELLKAKSRATAAAAREKKRAEAFRASLANLAPPVLSGTITTSEEDSDVDTHFPASSKSEKDMERIKSKRKASQIGKRTAKLEWKIKNGQRTETPRYEITKDEAARPVKYAAVEEPTILAPKPQRVGHVRPLLIKGGTHIDNFNGRNLEVDMVDYEVIGVHFYGWMKKMTAKTAMPDNFGIHVEGEKFLVALPYGLVDAIGCFLVGKVPSMETFLASQVVCRNLIRNINFSKAKSQEDAMIYAPYIAFTRRAHEREGMFRKLTGNVYTRMAKKCAVYSMGLGALSAVPVAAATHAGNHGIGTFAFVTTVAAATMVSAAALVIRASREYMRPSDVNSMKHRPLCSANSRADVPEQDPDFKIVRTTLDRKEVDAVKNVARVTGLAVKGQEPTVFATNQDNTVAALEKRSGAVPAPFDPKDRQHFCDWVEDSWETLVGKPYNIGGPKTPEAFFEQVESWLAGCNSAKHVKEIYRKTARRLADEGITPYSNFTAEQLHSWTAREASVKLETVLKDEDKSPRQILAATPEFVVLTAPFMKELTGHIKKKCGRNNKVVYTPGMSQKVIAEAMTEEDWDKIDNVDFDSFDLNQGDQTGSCEVRICERYGCPSGTLQLLRANLSTHGYARAGVKFSGRYVRHSGEPFTTLFNTVLNMFLAVYAFCRRTGKPVRDADIKVFAGGDDGVYLYNGPRINFKEEFARLGHPATTEEAQALHFVEFLSCRLVHTSTGWNLIPKPGQVIAKLGYSVRADTDEKAVAIAAGAVESMYAASHGCPPLRAYLDCVKRITNHCENPIYPADEPWKLTQCDTGKPTTTTWAQMYDVYGWSAELQASLEQRLSEVKEPGTEIESAALELLCDADSGHKNLMYERLMQVFSAEVPEFEKDLTTEGIEPNPGPTHKGRSKSKKSSSKKGRKTRARTPGRSIRGHGDYTVSDKNIGRNTGAAIGGAIGSWLEKGINSIFGSGDYTVKSNSMTKRLSGFIPTFKCVNGSLRISNREYLCDVITTNSSSFYGTSFIINACNLATFPWVSQIAQNFEQFKFHGLVFGFCSESGDAVASNNTALGTVIMATQYNPYDPPFNSKLQMEQYEFATSIKPSQSAIHMVECAQAQGAPNFLFCSTNQSGGDERFTNLGTFTIATVGQQNPNTNLGSLWVSYDIELCKPRMTDIVPSSSLSQVTGWYVSTNFSWTNIFGGNGAIINGSGNDLGAVFGNSSSGNANTILFPPGIVGRFVIELNVAVVTASATAPAFTLQANSPYITGYSCVPNATSTGGFSTTSTVPVNGISAAQWTLRYGIAIATSGGATPNSLQFINTSAPSVSNTTIVASISSDTWN